MVGASQQENSINLKLFSLTIFLFIIFTPNHSQAQVYIYAGCSLEKYDPNTPYQTNINSFLSSIASSSSQSLYDSFAVGNDSSASPDSAVFGLYQCRGDLETKDCSLCISSLISQIILVCPYTTEATLQLDRCSVSYEHTDFLGKVDTSLRYRKCSNTASNDVEFLHRREDVLTYLQGAMGFRVSPTGAVEGYAQCLGDLSRTDCSDCLSDAVTQVKSLCGPAVAGEVYLAQCYVRYWEAGHYDDSDSSNHDEVGRSVAIIVGAVAGIALVIVLLSFCKRSIGK